MGPALLLIAQLYRVEKQARPLTAEERLGLRQLQSRPILDKLHHDLLEIQAEMLPRSPEGRAGRYTRKNWTALTRYCEDGDLAIDIDNNATERAIRSVAVGRNNRVFFGSDELAGISFPTRRRKRRRSRVSIQQSLRLTGSGQCGAAGPGTAGRSAEGRSRAV
jgi:hypothetical protein